MESKASDIRIALYGPAASGKSATLRSIAACLGPEGIKRMVSLDTREKPTFYFDYLLIDMGQVAGVHLRFHLYALPGRPAYALATRMVLHMADAVVLTVDGRDGRLAETLASVKRASMILAESGRTLRSTPRVFQVNKIDLTKAGGGGALTERRLKGMGAPVIKTAATKGDGVPDLLKLIVQEVLHSVGPLPDGLPLSPRGKPFPVRVDGRTAREANAANEIYLRTFSASTTDYSPHSEDFLGAILDKFELIEPDQMKEARDYRKRAARDDLDMTLGEIIVKKGYASTEDLERSQQLKASSEILHEEIIFGKLALEKDYVSFDDFRKALQFQKSASFQYNLGGLLMNAGALEPEHYLEVMQDLRTLHRNELKAKPEASRTTAYVRKPEKKDRKTQMFFGSLAVRNKFISQKELDEALRIQKVLREKGINKYVGVILQEQGFLSQREVEVICSSLEKYLAKNPIEGYKIEAQLGRGAMGLVYAAVQLKLDRMVALKVLDPKYAMDPDYIQRFYREAKIAATLNHPNIVHAHDVGQSMGYHYFAMEYVEGVTVGDLLKERGVIDEDEALRIIMQVVSALHHAEKHRLVHLDIKPANIMITSSGTVKLCDLGLARPIDSQSGFSDSMIVGSPFYISPEQIERCPDLDTRADIYSLGATLFHMLCGRPPFVAEKTKDIFLKHLTNRLPDPLELNPKLSSVIPPLLKKMMEKSRDDRFQDMEELWSTFQGMNGSDGGELTPDRGFTITQRLGAMFRRK